MELKLRGGVGGGLWLNVGTDVGGVCVELNWVMLEMGDGSGSLLELRVELEG